MYATSGFTTVKLFLLSLLLAVLLSYSIKRETQWFIFARFNPIIDNWDYYKTDFYDLPAVEKINTTPCSRDVRSQPFWSPNGKYYGCSQPVVIHNINNKIISELNQATSEDHTAWGIWGWSPDSQYVSLIGNFGPEEDRYLGIAVMKYDGSQFYELNRHDKASLLYAEWSPDGKYIAHQLYPDPEDHDYLIIYKFTGEEVARFDMWDRMGTLINNIHWSPDGKKLAFLTKNAHLTILDIESAELTTITTDKPVCVMNIFDWSPDGERILFDAIDCRESWPTEEDILRAYSINVDGSDLKPLTEKSSIKGVAWSYYAAKIGGLHWTLDGKSILIDVYQYAGKGIFLLDADGNYKGKLVDDAYFVSWIQP